MKERVSCITEKELYRLIASYPEVDFYGLDVNQIEAVIEAFARVVRDGIEVDVEIPFPNVGTFYNQRSTYKGGLSNFTNPPTILPPKITRKLKFRPTNELKTKLKKENLLDENDNDTE